ncbi:MAG TPA: glycosyltransferase family 39 protein [Vicinamibacteria bacterium]|jgi:hypothetical protein
MIRAERRRAAAVFAGYVALAVASSVPLSTRPTQVLPDNADGVVFAWAIAWACHALGTDPLHLFRANVFHPDPAALAYGEPMIGQALLAWPVWALTGNDVLTFNLLYVLTLALAGWTMFLLAREVTGHEGAAALAGLVFAFTTANYDSAARIQIVSSQWTPLALYFLVRLARRGRLRDGAGLGLAFALQGLSCKYYQLFFATLLLATLPFFLRALPRPRLLHVPWRPLLVAGALAGTVLLPFDLAQQRHLARIESARGVSHPATAASYAQGMTGNWLYGERLGLVPTRYDDRYFPGFLPPVLALAGLLVAAPPLARRLRRTAPGASHGLLGAFLAFGLLAVLLSFGEASPLFRALNALVPGYAQTRVPSRFIMFARLSLALFAAVGVAALLRGARPLPRRLALVLLAVLLPLEHLSTPLPAWPVSSGARVPEVYRWLAARGPEGGPVLEFPPHPPRLRRWESFWHHFSTVHWLPLVNGFSSYYPVHYEFAYNELLELPSERSLAVLQGLGVRYLVVHGKPPATEEGDRALRRFERRAGEFADRLVLVKEFGDAGVRYPDPVGVLGGERVYRVEGARLVGPDSCAPDPPPHPRGGWRCEGDGCAQALDGDPRTSFETRQDEGRFVRVLFPHPLLVGRVSLRSGLRSQFYALAPEVRLLVDGRWTPAGHRFQALEFLGELLHCGERASQDLVLTQPTTAQGLEVRLGAQPNRFRAWALPELDVYP